MERVIVLNADYSFLNVINWKRAINLVFLGKVEVLKSTDRVVHNSNKTVEMFIPKVIRRLELIKKIYNTQVPWSKRNVYYRDQNICQYCRREFAVSELTLDHVMPKSRGGKNTFENTVASCKTCNNKKGDRTPEEAHMPLKRPPFQPTIMQFLTIKMKTLGIDKVVQEVWEYE